MCERERGRQGRERERMKRDGREKIVVGFSLSSFRIFPAGRLVLLPACCLVSGYLVSIFPVEREKETDRQTDRENGKRNVRNTTGQGNAGEAASIAIQDQKRRERT